MNTLMWMCAAFAVVIFGTIIHSVATFRAEGTSTANYQRRAIVEVVWALIPILIVVAAALPSFRGAQTSAVSVAASE